MSKKADTLAAECALGALDADMRLVAEARIERDSAFAAEVERWSQLLAGLTQPLAEVVPPDDLLDRIEAEIDGFDASPDNTITVRREKGEWMLLSEGVEYKVLWQEEKTGRHTVLIRMAPGASYETHHHDDVEECYVVSGDVSFGSHELRAGDFHVGLPGSDHPPASTRDGCLLLVSAAA